MNKTIRISVQLFSLIALLLVINVFNYSFSQHVEESCAFDKILKNKLLDPNYKKLYDMHNEEMRLYSKEHRSLNKSVVYIPIVVHILHKGESIGVGSNISNAQIQSAIDNLNAVYSNSVNGGVSVDLGVQFQLAKRDPNCNSTTGIVRVNASGVANYSTRGIDSDGTDGITCADEETLKDLSKWPTDQYMNFWIVSEIDNNNGLSGTQGYANLPVAIDAYNGSVMMSTVFGYDPTGTLFPSTMSFNKDNSTVTHEVGHFLDLYHPFKGAVGSGSCPPNQTNCSTEGDFVCDTPPIMNYLNHNNNTIYFNCPVGTANSCSTGNLDQVMRNIMNYTSCPDRFTAGQKSRIQACVATSRLGLTQSLGLTAPSGTYTAPISASCASITVGQGLTDGFAGITEVVFSNLIKNSSSTNIDNSINGYMDFTTSCLNVATVQAGKTYPLKVTTWFNTQKVKAFIDYNNNGVFTDSGEEVTPVGGLLSTNGAQVIRNVVIPGSPVLNTSLRMRVISDINSVSSSCHKSVYGQTEDYTIIITSASLTASVSIASSDTDNSICNGGSVTFTATPVNGGSTPVYQWKIGGINTGTNSPTFSTTGLSTGQVVTCELTSNLSNVQGSPATSTGITTTVNSTSAPTGAASQSFCTASTVANLTATGTAIKWYNVAANGNLLNGATNLVNGVSYYASQTINGCESVNRLAVSVTIASVLAPTGKASQAFCNAALISDLLPNGVSIKWYSTISNGITLSGGTSLVSGATYYASQTISGCESSSRLQVVAAISSGGVPDAPTGAASLSFCTASTVANLTATGTAIKWYNVAVNGNLLNGATNLVNGVSYYASQTINGCESVNRLAVSVTIASVLAPTGTASLSFCTASTVANLTATGTAIKWYKSLTGGTALAYNSSLSNGANYYASQTNSGCESSARLQVAVSIYAVPVVSISAIPSVCSSASPITLTQGLPIGGTYSGNGITNGLLNPSGLPVGFTTVTYSYTNVYLCSATAQTTVLINQCVGLVENEKLPISLFPNPTNGVLYINNLDERISEIRLIDNLGRIVLFEKNEMETSIVLDLSPFESGMYTIQFNSDVESFKSKIIIQK